MPSPKATDRSTMSCLRSLPIARRVAVSRCSHRRYQSPALARSMEDHPAQRSRRRGGRRTCDWSDRHGCIYVCGADAACGSDLINGCTLGYAVWRRQRAPHSDARPAETTTCLPACLPHAEHQQRDRLAPMRPPARPPGCPGCPVGFRSWRAGCPISCHIDFGTKLWRRTFHSLAVGNCQGLEVLRSTFNQLRAYACICSYIASMDPTERLDSSKIGTYSWCFLHRRASRCRCAVSSFTLASPTLVREDSFCPEQLAPHVSAMSALLHTQLHVHHADVQACSGAGLTRAPGRRCDVQLFEHGLLQHPVAGAP